LRLSQHRAHGTSLAIITFVAVAGVFAYWQAGNVDWQLVLALAPGAVLGAFVGAKAMVRVPALQLRLIFGLFLLFVAFRQLIWEVSAGSSGSGPEGLLMEVVFGFAGGLLAGVLGVGGGAIFVPAIVIFGLASLDPGEEAQKVAQGVSLAVIVLAGAVGTFANLRQDTIDFETARWIAPAAVAAAIVASIFANRLDVDVLKRIYGLAALFLGLQILCTTFRALQRGDRAEMEIERV
jgi:uncharacterized membrane protein YfcA